MGKSRNPSPENLLDIVGRFDGDWRDELQAMLDANDGRLNQELLMLISRRNQIAHGLNEGLNSRKAVELVLVSKQLADWFIRRFDPDVESSTEEKFCGLIVYVFPVHLSSCSSRPPHSSPT